MTRLVRLAWLVTVWLLLWGGVSVANVLSGMVVAVLVVAITGRRQPGGQIVLRPVAAARFAAHFAAQLVVATVVVAREVVTPENRIRTGIVAVPLRGCSDAVAVLIADAISLTPGTITVEMTRPERSAPTLYIHVLHLRDVEQVRRDVRRLEVLAVRAFGSPDAVRGLTVDDTRTVEAT